MLLEKLRIHKIKTVKKLLIFKKFNSLYDCIFSYDDDEEQKNISCILHDPNFDKVEQFFKQTPPPIGSVFKVMISKRRNYYYKKHIITTIIGIEEPAQMDIEHILTQPKA